MSIGTYGNIRPADVDVSDIDMFYTYAPNRETEATEVIRLNPVELISEHTIPTDEATGNTSSLLEGLYNMKLPATIFNQLGIYTIYIKPKTFTIDIKDCGVLSSLPSVRGLVIDGNSIDANLAKNNGLQGYRVEYYNISDGSKLRNTVRYVVTSNKVEPVTENIGTTTTKTTRYRFNDSGNLIFLQISPSSVSNLKPTLLPYIGTAGQFIQISNTFFNPIVYEIELVENDIDTIVNLVGSNQVKDVDNGILTHYDKDGNIIKQFDLYEIKDDVGNVSLYEVKEERTTIDTTQNFDDITSNLNG